MPSALRDEWNSCLKQAAVLHDRLAAVTHLGVSGREKRSGRLDHSQPPWSAPVALAQMELHAWVRMREAEWRALAKFPARKRGGSDENTRKALTELQRLAGIADDGSVLSSLRELSKWNRRVRMVLGELELPRRLPRHVGETEPACPFCRMRTLRMWALQGIVRCVNPACKNPEGRKPVARMEWSEFTGQIELVWNDGGVGLLVTEAASEQA